MNLQSLDLSPASPGPAAEASPAASGPPAGGTAFGQVFGELAGRSPTGQAFAAGSSPAAAEAAGESVPAAGDPASPASPASPADPALAAAGAWLNPLAWLGAEVAGGAAGPVPAEAGADLAAAGLLPAQAVALQAVDLGPSLRLITPAAPTPDGASLAAFAKAQGLDEAAVRWLLGDAAGGATAAGAGSAVGAGTGTGSGSGTGAGAAPAGGLAFFTGAGGTLTAAQGVAHATAVGPAGAAGHATPAATATASALLAGLSAAAPGGRAPGWMGAPDGAALPPDALAGLAAATRPGLWPRGAAVPSATGAAPAGPAPGGAAVPELVLDLSADLPEGLDGPDALQALGAWLARAEDGAGPAGGLDDALLVQALPGELGAADALDQPLAGDAGRPAAGSPAGAEAAARPLNAAALAASAERAAQAQADPTQRSEQYQALAQRLGEAMAQRLIAQAERGHWNVRFMLRPQSLGQVEVELRLRSGEMDALFRAPQALTRDLLTDGLPRLREVLAQMGMDVAQMHVSTGQGQKHGGNPTPRPAPANGVSQPGGSDEPAAAATAAATPRRLRPDGLDVLV